MTKLWKLLARYDEKNSIDNRSRTWESFASHYVFKPGTQEPVIDEKGNPKRNDTSVSLESWHDQIHGLVGTGSRYAGHTADTGYAGVKTSLNQSLLLSC